MAQILEYFISNLMGLHLQFWNPRPFSAPDRSNFEFSQIFSSRCFVVSACQFLKSSDYPLDHPLRKEHGEDKVLIRGGSCAVDPLGTVLVEPDFTKETIRYTEFDLSDLALGKMDLDVVGHYSRPDVFQLKVNENSQSTVVKK